MSVTDALQIAHLIFLSTPASTDALQKRNEMEKAIFSPETDGVFIEPVDRRYWQVKSLGSEPLKWL